MNSEPRPSIDTGEENRRLARILYILMGASCATYLFVLASAVYFNDRTLFAATLGGCVLLIVPFVLLRRRHLRASSLVVVLIILGTVTTIATVGQGIRDLAIVSFWRSVRRLLKKVTCLKRLLPQTGRCMPINRRINRARPIPPMLNPGGSFNGLERGPQC